VESDKQGYNDRGCNGLASGVHNLLYSSFQLHTLLSIDDASSACGLKSKMSNYVPFDDDFLSDLEREFGLLHPGDSNDEWDDLDLDLEGFCLVAPFIFGERKSYWVHKPKDWSEHIEHLQHTDRFHCK
jgi:hypothetical protein